MKIIKDIIIAIVGFIWGGIIVISFIDFANEILNTKLNLGASNIICGIAGIAVGALTIYFVVMGYTAITKVVPDLRTKIRAQDRIIEDYRWKLEKYENEED